MADIVRLDAGDVLAIGNINSAAALGNAAIQLKEQLGLAAVVGFPGPVDIAAVPHIVAAQAAADALRTVLLPVRLALAALPATCRYHGENTAPDRGVWTREACCDTGVPAQRRRLAEEALAALETAGSGGLAGA